MAAKLHFRYASMNSGKSTQLLQIAHNYEQMQEKVRVFTAAVDERDGLGIVSSRMGAQRKAEVFNPSTHFLSLLQGETDLACILVDEAQFLGHYQVVQLHQLAALHNIPVICFGLRTDFRGDPFVGSTYLLALADDIQEIRSVCECKRKATMNIRLDDDGYREYEGHQILIGGNERYKQVCARCFYQ